MGDIPKNETPEPVRYIFNEVTTFFGNYGWSILFYVIVGNILWSYVYPKYKRWREKKEEQEIAAEYKKDPSLIIQREEALIRSRQRLQERHAVLDAEHKQKEAEKMEAKKQEKLEERLKMLKRSDTSDSKHNGRSLRGDYNPLMGPGPTGLFRPSRREQFSGG